MTEPTYQYQPGKGWVVCVDNTHIVTMACGKRVRLEARLPGPGDCWDAGDKHWWGTQEDPDWGAWLRNFQNMRFTALFCSAGKAVTNPDKTYIVAVPLDD